MKKSKLSRLNKILEVPSEITSQIPKLTNLGFKKIQKYIGISRFFYKNKYKYRYYQHKWIWYENGRND